MDLANILEPLRIVESGRLTTQTCLALLFFGLIALAWVTPDILHAAKRVGRHDWIWLAGWGCAGLGLRLLGGIRIPAYPNSNGFNQMNTLLRGEVSIGPYGQSADALYTLLFSSVPIHEASFIAAQMFFSLSVIPATYAVWRLWSTNRDGARWAAAVAAVLPTQVFFGMTEEVLVSATFFLLLTLVVFGLAARLPRGALLVATAFFAAFTTQFRYVLHVFPAVILLFALATAAGRRLLARPAFWLSAVLLGALLAPSIISLVTMVVGQTPGMEHHVAMQMEALAMPAQVLRSMPCGPGGNAANVFLSPCMSPPLFSAVALLAVVVGIVSWRRRGAIVLATAAVAMLLTLTGLVSAYMNTARLQLPAQPFYAMLAGEGMALVLAALRGRLRLQARTTEIGGAVIVAAAVAFHPGSIGRLFTTQLERQVVVDGLAHVPDGCTILHAGVGSPPSYLSADRGMNLTWMNGSSLSALEEKIETGCWIYFRSHRCSVIPGQTLGGKDLRTECAALEARLHLEPLFVRSIAALPDNVDTFAADSLRVGFYRIVPVKPGRVFDQLP